MEKELEPAFVKQLQVAVDRGQVVLLPAQPATQPVRLQPRNRSQAALAATFCLLFKLTRSESGMLVQLLAHDFASKKDLHTAVSIPVGWPVTDSCMQTVLSRLRKKLKPHNIQIITIKKLGYGLDRDARYRIRSLLARYDTGFMPKRGRKPKAVETDLNPNTCA